MRYLAEFHTDREVQTRYWLALQVERALYASALLVAGHLALRGLVVSAQGGL